MHACLSKTYIGCFFEEKSSESGDGVIYVWHSVGSVLVVDTFPLIVVVMLVIYGTVDDWLPHVHKEEEGHDWEGEADPVAREADVEVPIALV